MSLAKTITDSASGVPSSHLPRRLAEIGLQTAVLYERPALVAYFLSQGASPLCPHYSIDPSKVYQDIPPLFSATEPELVNRQYGNSLHHCAKAGVSAAVIGKMLIDHLKPGYMDNMSEGRRAALNA